MLTETKNDLIYEARKLVRPYESYSIDELADAYCDAVDSQNETLKSIYISALILRFWHKIDKMYRANTVAPSLEYEDFFWWLYEAIEYACKYRGWRDAEKNLNAQQCINKCIDTIKLQKYYNLRLDKNKAVNHCTSMDTPMYGDDESVRTLGDTIETEETYDDLNGTDAMMLIQGYINKNKIIEAILLDNIAFNDVNRYYKKTIKTKNSSGEDYKYVEHSSEFWAYKLVKIINEISSSAEYEAVFARRYTISDSKLTASLEALHKMNNQKIYKSIRRTLSELRATYCV